MTMPLIRGFKLAMILLLIYLGSQAGVALIPIFISFILAFILHPFVVMLRQITIGAAAYRLSATWAILLTFIAALVLLALIMMVLFTPFIEEFQKFYKNIPQIVTGIQQLIVEFEHNVLLPLAKSGIYQPQSEQMIALLQQAITSSLSFSFNLLKNLANLSMHVVFRLIEFIVVPVLTFYFIKDWRSMVETAVNLFAPMYRGEARTIILAMGQVISDFLRGQFLLCLIIGSCMFAGLYALDIEYPLVLALLAGIAEAIPIIGPILSAVPAIVLGTIYAPVLGLKVAIFCFFLQQVENHIIVPKVMGGSIHLHPAVVIISILIAGQFMGMIGMMAALPAIALLRVFMQHFWITEEAKSCPNK